MIHSERHESALGSWAHASWSPPAGTRLDGLVERIWYFDGILVARRERVFPDGTIELIVQLDEPHRLGGLVDADGFPPVCVTGLRLTSEIVLAPPGRCRVVGIVLAPPCAQAILQESLVSLTGITADLHDLVGRAASDLAAKVDVKNNPIATIEAARTWVLQRLDRGGRPRAAFREAFGVTPKRYQRIKRFARALQTLSRGGSSLADIAYANGYYDQAHFSNEFRAHAGLSPTAFLRAVAFPSGGSLAEA